MHEGPARISKLGTVPLKRGMILSNEPGYYKTGGYGIRIENLMLVAAAPASRRRGKDAQRLRDADLGADRPPPDRHRACSTAGERLWIDSYHTVVRDALRAASRRRDAKLARGRRPRPLLDHSG